MGVLQETKLIHNMDGSALLLAAALACSNVRVFGTLYVRPHNITEGIKDRTSQKRNQGQGARQHKKPHTAPRATEKSKPPADRRTRRVLFCIVHSQPVASQSGRGGGKMRWLAICHDATTTRQRVRASTQASRTQRSQPARKDRGVAHRTPRAPAAVQAALQAAYLMYSHHIYLSDITPLLYSIA